MVNVHRTVALAKSLAANGVFTVFPSTNLVYDGAVPFRKADDPVCPQTEYGRQKAEAERQLLALGDLLAVVRITKVLGPNLPPFREWIRALQDHDAIHPFSDVVMAPVPLPFVVDMLYRTAERRMPGIVQVSGEKDITYEQVARHVAGRIGARPELVQPVRASEAHLQLETIPLHTTLDTSRLLTEFGIEPPDVWSVIDSMLHQTLQMASSSERG
jgi:dTDP-4-dehydrorhamnose reductase